MAGKTITKTLTITSLTAAGDDRVTIGFAEVAETTGAFGMGLNVTVSNAEATGYAVHDDVTLTLAPATTA